jgi:hypothetical protein
LEGRGEESSKPVLTAEELEEVARQEAERAALQDRQERAERFVPPLLLVLVLFPGCILPLRAVISRVCGIY